MSGNLSLHFWYVLWAVVGELTVILSDVTQVCNMCFRYVWCLDFKGGLFCSTLSESGLTWQRFEDNVHQVALSPSGELLTCKPAQSCQTVSFHIYHFISWHLSKRSSRCGHFAFKTFVSLIYMYVHLCSICWMLIVANCTR